MFLDAAIQEHFFCEKTSVGRQFLVITQRCQSLDLRMKDPDDIIQQPVGAEGRLLIEKTLFHITAIDLLFAVGLELVVAVMLGLQLTIGDRVVTAITEQPRVGIASLLSPHG